jgi:hypothetical protein
MALSVWDSSDYNGGAATIDYGDYKTLSGTGISDNQISSLKVAPFTTVIVYEETHFGGKSTTIVGPKDIPNLDSINMNNRISSMKVVKVVPPLDVLFDCCTGTKPTGCGSYIPNTPLCDSIIQNYCAGNMHNSFCKQWCKEGSRCDDIVMRYCATPVGRNDTYCACINSPANSTNVNPKCVDRNCLQSGYLPNTMMKTACPAIITCEANVQLINSGVILSNTIPIQQNCGGGTTTKTVTYSTKAPTTGTKTSTFTKKQPTTSTIFTPMMILLFVIFMVIIGVLIMVYRNKVGAIKK